jgi:hypothetical protein
MQPTIPIPNRCDNFAIVPDVKRNPHAESYEKTVNGYDFDPTYFRHLQRNRSFTARTLATWLTT